VATGDLQRERVDLDRLVLDIEARIRRHSHAHRVVLSIDPEMAISVDRSLFAPAFEELLTAAWERTADLPVGHVQVGRLRGPDGWAYFVREDGLAAGTVPRAFAEVIRAHGGRTWTENAPGAGTTIYFTV
jgi:signal transduction histidine kinase